jgi:hypothetical protein
MRLGPGLRGDEPMRQSTGKDLNTLIVTPPVEGRRPFKETVKFYPILRRNISELKHVDQQIFAGSIKPPILVASG